MQNDHDREPRNRHEDKTEPAGTIPNEKDGVGLTSNDEPTSFEPEEDPEAEPEEIHEGHSSQDDDGR